MVKFAGSLRERQKAETRDALAAEAFRLCKQRGFDGVTIDEIAEAAEVSRRTFFRYFPTKESAFFPHTADRLQEFRDLLAARKPGDSAFVVARRAFRSFSASEAGARTEGVARRKLIRKSPPLLAHERTLDDLYARILADAFAADRSIGGGPRRARVLAAATVALVQTTVRAWVEEQGQGDLQKLVDEALDVVQLGAEAVSRGQTRRLPPERGAATKASAPAGKKRAAGRRK